MTRVRHVVYFHGFASSPASSKATRFRDALTARGIGFTCPDFNLPSFETLTVTRMLTQAAEAIASVPEGPIALVGSSLGAFIAVHAAAADLARRTDRLVLLAPAFDFGGNRLRQLGDQGIEEWRRTGRLEVFHYAFNEQRSVGFGLYEDAARYDAYALTLDRPALVIQGRQDALVSPESVEAWCATRPLADLHLIDDDHQLTASWDVIWDESARLFGIEQMAALP